MKAKNLYTLPFELTFPVFWDTDPSLLDLQKNKEFIISRVFERGGIEDIVNVTAYYGENSVRNVLSGDPYLSKSAIYLAHSFFQMPLNQFKSYAKNRDRWRRSIHVTE